MPKVNPLNTFEGIQCGLVVACGQQMNFLVGGISHLYK